MRDLVWDRAAQASHARERLWRVVSPATVPVDEVVPIAAALTQLPQRDQGWLAALHLVLSREAENLLAAAPSLLRRLSTVTTPVIERHPDRLRGPVDWPSTINDSMRSGRRWSYATRPTERDYATPGNRLLMASLLALRDAARTVGWEDGAAGSTGLIVASRGTEADRLLGGAALRRIPHAVEARDLLRVQRGRSARQLQPVTDFYRLHRRLVMYEDLALLRFMIESTALLHTDDGALFEFLVLLDVFDWLEQDGWSSGRPRLLRGGVHVTHLLGSDRLEVHFQHVPTALGAASIYGSILAAHGLAASALRPDLVLVHTKEHGRRRLLLVEVKNYRALASGVRAALVDLLAYQRAYSLFAPEPIASLGVAFGAGLKAVPAHEVALCTPDRLRVALRDWIARPVHAQPPTSHGALPS